eukprot:scaffold9715_cov113-Isochrysis_galbana.AAC.17
MFKQSSTSNSLRPTSERPLRGEAHNSARSVPGGRHGQVSQLEGAQPAAAGRDEPDGVAQLLARRRAAAPVQPQQPHRALRVPPAERLARRLAARLAKQNLERVLRRAALASATTPTAPPPMRPPTAWRAEGLLVGVDGDVRREQREQEHGRPRGRVAQRKVDGRARTARRCASRVVVRVQGLAKHAPRQERAQAEVIEEGRRDRPEARMLCSRLAAPPGRASPRRRASWLHALLEPERRLASRCHCSTGHRLRHGAWPVEHTAARLWLGAPLRLPTPAAPAHAPNTPTATLPPRPADAHPGLAAPGGRRAHNLPAPGAPQRHPHVPRLAAKRRSVHVQRSPKRDVALGRGVRRAPADPPAEAQTVPFRTKAAIGLAGTPAHVCAITAAAAQHQTGRRCDCEVQGVIRHEADRGRGASSALRKPGGHRTAVGLARERLKHRRRVASRHPRHPQRRPHPSARVRRGRCLHPRRPPLPGERRSPSQSQSPGSTARSPPCLPRPRPASTRHAPAHTASRPRTGGSAGPPRATRAARASAAAPPAGTGLTPPAGTAARGQTAMRSHRRPNQAGPLPHQPTPAAAQSQAAAGRRRTPRRCAPRRRRRRPAARPRRAGGRGAREAR